MSSSENNGNVDDLPAWVVSLGRAVVRDCRRPGRYVVEFEVSDHKSRVKVVVVARVETLRRLEN